MTHPESVNEQQNETKTKSEPIVQYILVRTDLNWSTGALIAQACHASVAAITKTLDNQNTKDYLNDIDNMHKIILKADKVEDLTEAEEKLNGIKVSHRLWIEQPENIPTCLAVSPQPKSLVQAIFKQLKLFK